MPFKISRTSIVRLRPPCLAGGIIGSIIAHSASINVPFLIALGDNDFVRLDHAIETFQLIPRAQLAVIPDAGHFVLNSEQQRVMPAIEAFLDGPMSRVPFATTETGYHPGVTR